MVRWDDTLSLPGFKCEILHSSSYCLHFFLHGGGGEERRKLWMEILSVQEGSPIFMLLIIGFESLSLVSCKAKIKQARRGK